MTSSSLIKHASHGLKHRGVRDYLKMRFAKAGPAAASLGNKAAGVGKSLAGNLHVQGLGGALAINAAAKRKTDTKPEEKERFGASARAGYGAAGAANFGMLNHKLHKQAASVSHTATANRIRGIGTTAGRVGLVAGAIGAHSAHKAFKKNKAERGVKASFDESMILSHDAEARPELQLSRSPGMMPAKPRSVLKSAAYGAAAGGIITGHPLGAVGGAIGSAGGNVAKRVLRKARAIKTAAIAASHDELELGSRITPLPNKFGGVKKTMPFSTMQNAAKSPSVAKAQVSSAVSKLKSVNKINLLKSQVARRTVTAGAAGAIGGAGAVGAGLLAHHLISKARSKAA